MKKILASLGSIVFASALLAGGTGAYFADSNTSTGNTFATGVVDLKVDNESYVTSNSGALVASPTTSWALSSLAGKLFFNFLDLKPGDVGEDTISLHVNNNDAWICMNIALQGTPENGQNDPELAVDPTIGTNDGELQNNLYFAFWADDGDNVYESGESIFKQGLVKDIFTGQNWALADSQTNVWGPSGPLPGGATKYIGKAWCFGTMAQTPLSQDNKGKVGNNGPLVRGTGFSCSGQDVGNAVQSDGIKANVSFTVAQSRSNGSYRCTPGDPTPPPTSISTLFSDNFGTCKKDKEFNKIDNAKWDQTGGVKGDDHGNPHGLVAYFKGPTTKVLTSGGVNTTGYHNITLKYDRNMDVPSGTTASLKVEYSVNGGSSWTTLETVTVDHDWITKTWNLSPSADNKPSVKIRFTFVGSATGDHAFIDNVVMTGVTP
jgi:predicted ribosomally synthesized peptide with SipW-like signal peptide